MPYTATRHYRAEHLRRGRVAYADTSPALPCCIPCAAAMTATLFDCAHRARLLLR